MIEVKTWLELGLYDEVVVDGETGRFAFVSAREVDGEVVSVNVYGGPDLKYTPEGKPAPFCGMSRAFVPERVTKYVPKKRGRKKIEAVAAA